MPKLKALSYSHVVECETASKPHCDCRCGGLLHGANRVSPAAGAAGFHALPADDPHHLQTKVERKRSTKVRRRERQRAANAVVAARLRARVAARMEAREKEASVCQQ